MLKTSNIFLKIRTLLFTGSFLASFITNADVYQISSDEKKCHSIPVNNMSISDILKNLDNEYGEEVLHTGITSHGNFDGKFALVNLIRRGNAYASEYYFLYEGAYKDCVEFSKAVESITRWPDFDISN